MDFVNRTDKDAIYQTLGKQIATVLGYEIDEDAYGNVSYWPNDLALAEERGMIHEDPDLWPIVQALVYIDILPLPAEWEWRIAGRAGSWRVYLINGVNRMYGTGYRGDMHISAAYVWLAQFRDNGAQFKKEPSDD
jgi:hypothetical protein